MVTRDPRHKFCRPLLPLLLILPLFAVNCATSLSSRGAVARFSERGLASWYGPDFHGKRTASGEIYDMHRLTAAHRTLPFGTLVEVRNRDNGRKTRVRITDRGPFVRGRVIDLSYAAASDLRMLGPGVVPVEIRVIAVSETAAETGDFWVQAGAFRDARGAEALYRRLQTDFPEVRLSSDGSWHRVRLGPFSKRKRAERTRRELLRLGVDAFLTTS